MKCTSCGDEDAGEGDWCWGCGAELTSSSGALVGRPESSTVKSLNPMCYQCAAYLVLDKVSGYCIATQANVANVQQANVRCRNKFVSLADNEPIGRSDFNRLIEDTLRVQGVGLGFHHETWDTAKATFGSEMPAEGWYSSGVFHLFMFIDAKPIWLAVTVANHEIGHHRYAPRTKATLKRELEMIQSILGISDFGTIKHFQNVVDDLIINTCNMQNPEVEAMWPGSYKRGLEWYYSGVYRHEEMSTWGHFICKMNLAAAMLSELNPVVSKSDKNPLTYNGSNNDLRRRFILLRSTFDLIKGTYAIAKLGGEAYENRYTEILNKMQKLNLVRDFTTSIPPDPVPDDPDPDPPKPKPPQDAVRIEADEAASWLAQGVIGDPALAFSVPLDQVSVEERRLHFYALDQIAEYFLRTGKPEGEALYKAWKVKREQIERGNT